MSIEAQLTHAIELTQATLAAGVGQVGVLDVGFIGNTSGAYPWEPALIVDIDVCLFVERKDAPLGHWLLARRDELGTALDRLGMDLEFKVLRGPYKPARWHLARPVVIAHLAVFTAAAYALEPPALRWSWRKYRCVVEPTRFSAACGVAPGWPELRAMATRKRARLHAERVEMTEWELPDFVERVREFDSNHPVFAEYCLAAPLLCARNHGRVLGRPEADRLSNREYGDWYARHIFATAALGEILRLKDRARQQGYAGLLPHARDEAAAYLGELLAHLPPEASATPT